MAANSYEDCYDNSWHIIPPDYVNLDDDYRFSIQKDCNKCYIGQTKQYLKKRIYNHQYTVTHNVTAETALFKHSKDIRHNFDFQNIKILKKENNYKKRLIYEMKYIKKDENARKRKDIKKGIQKIVEKSRKRCEIILYVQVVVVVIKVAEEEKKSTPTEAVMPPSAAAPFLAWPPLLLHPWAPALLPGAWCSSAAAIRLLDSMKVTNGGQRTAGFAISDILELNDRTPGLEATTEPPNYPTHHDLISGQTLLTPSTRHWPLTAPAEIGKVYNYFGNAGVKDYKEVLYSYKTKRAMHEKGMHDQQNNSSAPSPRRVAVPVLVRDGKPCLSGNGSKPTESLQIPGSHMMMPAYTHQIMQAHRGWW
ncbi:homeobox protein nkx [Holotrichia oblita]|uniref:Homeobox protein nkx n=1 Tax=Holotrichia oblita TaxID=644536 RepID=A0ACB9T9Y9_HOLOL|nr:homeobox protein nkx [Holotrichia oblita]